MFDDVHIHENLPQGRDQGKGSLPNLEQWQVEELEQAYMRGRRKAKVTPSDWLFGDVGIGVEGEAIRLLGMGAGSSGDGERFCRLLASVH